MAILRVRAIGEMKTAAKAWGSLLFRRLRTLISPRKPNKERRSGKGRKGLSEDLRKTGDANPQGIRGSEISANPTAVLKLVKRIQKGTDAKAGDELYRATLALIDAGVTTKHLDVVKKAARALRELGLYLEGQAMLQKAIAAVDGYPAMRATLQRELAKIQTAKNRLKPTTEVDKRKNAKDGDALYLAAMELIDAGEATQHLVRLQKAVRTLGDLGLSLEAESLVQRAAAAPGADLAMRAVLQAELAKMQADQGRLEEALELAEHALQSAAGNPVIFQICARLARSVGDFRRERAFIERAVALQPDDVKWISRLADIDQGSGNHEAAFEVYRRVAKLDPNRIDAHCGIARCLLGQFRHDEAIDYLVQQTAAHPAAHQLHQLLGRAYRFCGRDAEARIALERALELEPESQVALPELAELLQNGGYLDEAIAVHRRIVALNDNARRNATLYLYALLAAGRAEGAWAIYRDRVEHFALRQATSNVWQGEDLAGRSLLVIREGGTGDEIRDASTYRDVIQAAGRVTITCEPRMLDLLRRSFPEARFLPVQRERRHSSGERLFSLLVDETASAEMSRHDFVTLSPELLAHFRADGDFINKAQRYLVPLPKAQSQWRACLDALGPGLKIGISWRSGVALYHRDVYYTQLADWGPILRLSGVHFVTLQYGDVADELAAAERAFGVHVHRFPNLNLKDDFDGVAALVSELDLVLAPNNTLLELAGAVGAPAWYMIRVPRASDDWRHLDPATGQDRFYRTVRQVRGKPWDSPSLVSEVVTRIQALQAGRPESGAERSRGPSDSLTLAPSSSP